MGKNYLLIIFLFLIISNSGISQCTPNTLYADSSFGVWPNTTENLPCVYAGSDYEADINIKTLTDTTVSFDLSGTPTVITAYIEAFRVNAVNGLPAGFSYLPNASVWTNGGATPNFIGVQGCLQIVATSEAVQALLTANPSGIDFDLTVVVDAKIKNTSNSFADFLLANKWLSEVQGIPGVQAIPVTGYQLRIRAAGADCTPLVGLNEISKSQFNLAGNFPNPFNKTTEVRFTTSKNQVVEFEVFNMVGKQVMHQNLKTNKGSNSFVFTNEGLKPGIYFYTISDGKKSFTRKMVISEN